MNDRNSEIIYEEGWRENAAVTPIEPEPLDEQDESGNVSPESRKAESGSFPLLLTLQLAVCLIAALVLFLFKTMGNEQYNSFIEFYKEELQKPVISRSVFDAADLSRLFAGGEVKVLASPDEAEGR